MKGREEAVLEEGRGAQSSDRTSPSTERRHPLKAWRQGEIGQNAVGFFSRKTYDVQEAVAVGVKGLEQARELRLLSFRKVFAGHILESLLLLLFWTKGVVWSS